MFFKRPQPQVPQNKDQQDTAQNKQPRTLRIEKGPPRNPKSNNPSSKSEDLKPTSKKKSPSIHRHSSQLPLGNSKLKFPSTDLNATIQISVKELLDHDPMAIFFAITLGKADFAIKLYNASILSNQHTYPNTLLYSRDGESVLYQATGAGLLSFCDFIKKNMCPYPDLLFAEYAEIDHSRDIEKANQSLFTEKNFNEAIIYPNEEELSFLQTEIVSTVIDISNSSSSTTPRDEDPIKRVRSEETKNERTDSFTELRATLSPNIYLKSKTLQANLEHGHFTEEILESKVNVPLFGKLLIHWSAIHQNYIALYRRISLGEDWKAKDDSDKTALDYLLTSKENICSSCTSLIIRAELRERYKSEKGFLAFLKYFYINNFFIPRQVNPDIKKSLLEYFLFNQVPNQQDTTSIEYIQDSPKDLDIVSKVAFGYSHTNSHSYSIEILTTLTNILAELSKKNDWPNILRTIYFLQQWISSDIFNKFTNQEKFRSQLDIFINTIPDIYKDLANRLKNYCLKKQNFSFDKLKSFQEKNSQPLNRKAMADIFRLLGESNTLIENSEEINEAIENIANDLYHMHKQILLEFEPAWVTSQKITKEEDEQLKKIKLHHQRLSMKIAENILSPDEIETVFKIYKLYLKVASVLYEKKDYYGAHIITSSFFLQSVNRLNLHNQLTSNFKKHWDNLNKIFVDESGNSTKTFIPGSIPSITLWIGWIATITGSERPKLEKTESIGKLFRYFRYHQAALIADYDLFYINKTNIREAIEIQLLDAEENLYIRSCSFLEREITLGKTTLHQAAQYIQKGYKIKVIDPECQENRTNLKGKPNQENTKTINKRPEELLLQWLESTTINSSNYDDYKFLLTSVQERFAPHLSENQDRLEALNQETNKFENQSEKQATNAPPILNPPSPELLFSTIKKTDPGTSTLRTKTPEPEPRKRHLNLVKLI